MIQQHSFPHALFIIIIIIVFRNGVPQQLFVLLNEPELDPSLAERTVQACEILLPIVLIITCTYVLPPSATPHYHLVNTGTY